MHKTALTCLIGPIMHKVLGLLSELWNFVRKGSISLCEKVVECITSQTGCKEKGPPHSGPFGDGLWFVWFGF